jgi:hypothetical protein
MSPQQRAFLEAFKQTGNVSTAAAAAEVGRRTHYDWLKELEYAAAFDDAREAAIERLEAEAQRRAHAGVEKIVVSRGEIVWAPLLDESGCVVLDNSGKPVTSGRPLVERTYSHNLLMFLLKPLRPDRYRENVKVEHAGELRVITERLNAARQRLKEAA